MPNEDLLEKVEPFLDVNEPGLGDLAELLLHRMQSRRNPVQGAIHFHNPQLTLLQTKSLLLQLGPETIAKIIGHTTKSALSSFPGVYQVKLINPDNTGLSSTQVRKLADDILKSGRLTQLLGTRTIGQRTLSAVKMWARYWASSDERSEGDEDEDEDYVVEDEEISDVESSQVDEWDNSASDDGEPCNTKISYVGYSVNPKTRLLAHANSTPFSLMFVDCSSKNLHSLPYTPPPPHRAAILGNSLESQWVSTVVVLPRNAHAREDHGATHS
jgi:hypothetical protein